MKTLYSHNWPPLIQRHPTKNKTSAHPVVA